MLQFIALMSSYEWLILLFVCICQFLTSFLFLQDEHGRQKNYVKEYPSLTKIQQKHSRTDCWSKLRSKITFKQEKDKILKQIVENNKKFKNLTKDIDAQPHIYQSEEAIEKMNKPPCDVESYCNRKQNHIAKVTFCISSGYK